MIALAVHTMLQPAEALAVFEVARSQQLPDNTPADHPKIYRHDVVDVRNANGRFLAAAWQDIADLLAYIEVLERNQRQPHDHNEE